MIKIIPTEEQISYSKHINDNFNLGNRGYGDGNKQEQYIGILGQIVLADILEINRIKGNEGFDEGIDFVINNKKVDVKTMGRTVDVRSHFVHNFIGYQMKYVTDYYIFQSYNRIKNELSICGFVSKNELIDRSLFYEKGTIRYRDDGSSFINKAPLYEIKQMDLNPINNVKDILINII
jgi:hypothetical protein